MRRPRRGTFRGARVASLLLGSILAALLVPDASLAAPFFARACVTQDFSSFGSNCQQNEGNSMALAQAQYGIGAIYLNAGSSAMAGSLAGESRSIMQHMTDWSSGHITAYTDASLNESIDPNWADWAARGYDSMADIDHYRFEFQLEVSGNQSASFGGTGAAGATSTVRYTYSVGGVTGSGSKSTYGNENYGTWGIVDASFMIGKGASYTLSMGSHTDAGGSKTYVPWSEASIDATADFSHTLRWMGITGIHAFDRSGNEISLPAEARLPMIGRESGFDYWYAASPVPEPASTLLLCAGLAGLAGYAKTNSGRRRRSPEAQRDRPE